MRAILISFLCVLLFCNFVYAETIISEGTAFIGSGITLEDAKTIALNDAKQKALNSLGAFVESESRVVDGRLTKDEIRSITGAVMSSEILESSKQVIQDAFVLKVKVKFDVSESSLQRSIKNYQNKSTDRKTIDHLTRTISKLQKDLISRKKADRHSVELVDEINYSTKRLSELLTTKQKIDYELQMQTLYKDKIRETFIKKILLPFNRELRKFLRWNTVPTMMHGDLVLKFIGCNKLGNNYREYFEELESMRLKNLDAIVREYNALHLKVYPKFMFRILYKIPVHVFINGEKISQYLRVTFDGGYSRVYLTRMVIKLNGKFFFISETMCNRFLLKELNELDISLPKHSTLSKIEDIHIRIGRVELQDIEFSFFGSPLIFF
jgi:hypothetical protein